jgi:hypothetical protein
LEAEQKDPPNLQETKNTGQQKKKNKTKVTTSSTNPPQIVPAKQFMIHKIGASLCMKAPQLMIKQKGFGVYI